MKSIKEISKELGVSKRTIFSNIKRLDVETVKEDNTSLIKNDIDVGKITQRITRNKKEYRFEDTLTNSEKAKKDNSQKESKHNAQIVELLEKQIDTLNRQLEKQEKHHEVTAESCRKELQERSKLLENQQVLVLESNKKIQKLESQLEEERQLNNSFDIVTSNRQDINLQEATFAGESRNTNQQQKKSQPTENEINHEDIPEEKKNDRTKGDKSVEETKSNSDDNREVEPPKKGFWSRFLGN